MRPLIALAGSALLMLGIHTYLRFAASLRAERVVVVEETAAQGTYSARITLTFDAQADEFSLEPTSLVFRQQGKELLKRVDAVSAGEPLTVDNITGIVEGANEFYFECVPRADDKLIARAVRVQLLRDGEVVADKTMWAEPGQVPRGQIALEVSPTPSTKGDHADRS